MKENLITIFNRFATDSIPQSVEPMGAGLINDTYRVVAQKDGKPCGFVLQRINHHIFKNVDQLMFNICAVTDHIRQKLTDQGASDIERKVLTFLPLRYKNQFYCEERGEFWRVMKLIPEAHTKEEISPESAYLVGVAFGNFESMLADLKTPLYDTIPDFHNMEFRLRQLEEAIENDDCGRLKQVKYYVEQVRQRADEMCKAERLGREGKLPKRVCHCDTKVNNMMFSKEGEVLCVIDLDTVMPSFIFSDYSDFLRTGANPVAEDEEDLTQIDFDLEIFKSFTKGYIESASSFLTPLEIEMLPYAVGLFPYMQCVRFLTDYINGDTYYKIKYPDHNLVRTKAQFRLLEKIEEKMPQIQTIIRELNR